MWLECLHILNIIEEITFYSNYIEDKKFHIIFYMKKCMNKHE